MSTQAKLEQPAVQEPVQQTAPKVDVTESLPEPPADLVSLTTMLERALNPRSSMAAKIKILGMHGLPDDLVKSLEDKQPFIWKARIWQCDIDGGKYCPRVLTEEEQEAAKTKKNLKTVKDVKDKGETKIAVQEGLTEPVWIQNMENKFKNPAVKFPNDEFRVEEPVQPGKPGEIIKGPTIANLGQTGDMKASHTLKSVDQTQAEAENAKDIEFDPEQRFKFELIDGQLADMEQSLQSGKALLVLERFPNISEDELAKQRKKLKGAALKELNPLVLHALLPMEDLQKPGSKSSIIRAHVKQVGDLTSDQECNQYSFINTYVKVEISSLTDDYFTSEVNDLFPRVISLSEQALVPKISNRNQGEHDFTASLNKALITLSDDYKSTIKIEPKQDDHSNEKMTTHKLRQIEEKKKHNQKVYIDKFMVSSKYAHMKNQLSPFVLRLVHDKLEKEMVGDKEAHLDSSRLISELNIYFQHRLEEVISSVISRAVDFDFHKDFVQSFVQEKSFKQGFIKEMGDPKSTERMLELAKEYEKLNLKVMAEKRFKDIAMDPSLTDPQILVEFMAFDLRQLNYIRAEETLWRIQKLTPELSDTLKLVQACFFIHRKLIPKALGILEDLLEKDKFKSLHNTFMAFLQIFYQDRPKLGKKYFAVSQRRRQRELGLIPPPSAKPEKNSEKLPELSEKESDELWLDLANFFTNFCFVDFSFKAIEMVKNKDSFRCLSTLSTLEFLRNDLDKAGEIHDKMLKVGGPQVTADVYMLKATNAFAREYYYEAEELIYASLKLTGSLGENDMVTLPRLGYIYIRRKSYEDARGVFLSSCAANPKSALNWLGLAISCMRIGENLHFDADYFAKDGRANDENAKREEGDLEYQKSEDALRMANIYDPTSSEVWCYSILLSLKDTRKLQQASKLLKYLMSLEVENIQLLTEVA